MPKRCSLVLWFALGSTLIGGAQQTPSAPAAPATAKPLSAQQPSVSQAQPAKPPVQRATLLLAYWPPEEDVETAENRSDQTYSKAFIDTIAILDGSQLIDPWGRTSDVPGQVNKWMPHFDKNFFPVGRLYDVYEGGEKVDTASVVRPEPISCDGLSAIVKLTTSGPARKALAGGHPRDTHPDWRRPATPEQKVAFLRLTQDALEPSGVVSNQVRVQNLAVTRLDERLPPLLIGDAAGGSHRVFLIAEPDSTGTGYKQGIAAVHDVGEEGSNTDQREEFLDQLDVTGDGVDEIVTIVYLYESWTYNIYRRDAKGVWQNIYDGGGGGC